MSIMMVEKSWLGIGNNSIVYEEGKACVYVML